MAETIPKPQYGTPFDEELPPVGETMAETTKPVTERLQEINTALMAQLEDERRALNDAIRARHETNEKLITCMNERNIARERVEQYVDCVDRLRARLAAAQAEIDELKVEREWISVDKELPKTESLFYDPKHGVFIDCFESDLDGWYLTVNEFHEPTHWQPLPKPPEAK
jgi:hypothetical protein